MFNINWRRPIVAVAAAAAVVILGGGGYALAANVTASPQDHACVNNVSHAMYDNPSAGNCPQNWLSIAWNVTGPQGPQGIQGLQGKTGATGPAGSYTPVTATASTAISNDTDSGAHGNWATDTITRSMTVTRRGAVAVSNCGGNASNGITSCYYYTAAMTDTGAFITLSGANSPQAGTAINGVLSGTLSGGSNYEFYATSGTPSASSVPATLDASSGSGSSTWPEHFFPAATSFGGMNEINWVYTYSAPTTCEQWVDAYNNSGGLLAADGDISGTNACKS